MIRIRKILFNIMLIVPLLLSFGCSTLANKEELPNSNNQKDNLEILTLFSSKSKSQNKAWIGTFQLVFNDMKDNIVKKDIIFANEKPTQELEGLNAKEFNKDMLNEKSYYTSYGLASIKAKEKIKKEIKEKFNTTSRILDSFNWEEKPGKHYAYAMLKKEFDFLTPFDKLEKKSFNNSKKQYKFFGINDNSKSELDDNVRVMFYNNPNDYAVSLNTTNQDIVYLYRTDSNDDFRTLFEKLQKETKNYDWDRKFNPIDTLVIPELTFKETKEYNNLCNKFIEGTDLYFSKAIETIEFKLDNTGGKVKSEAGLMMELSAMPMLPDKPRHFNFDKTFVLFLIDSGKQDPYMALRIKNLEGLQ